MSLPCLHTEDNLKERIVWIENFIEVRENERRGEWGDRVEFYRGMNSSVCVMNSG